VDILRTDSSAEVGLPMLVKLGRPVLSNADELRRLFDTWKKELSSKALERIRRHFWSDFEAGRSLDSYVSMRDLDFLEFQEEWVLDREHLAKADVGALLDATRKYRILYVPFVFDPSRWCVMELPNPLSAAGRGLFREIGAGATRLKFGIAQ
jgi:hypothetical protein